MATFVSIKILISGNLPDLLFIFYNYIYIICHINLLVIKLMAIMKTWNCLKAEMFKMWKIVSLSCSTFRFRRLLITEKKMWSMKTLAMNIKQNNTKLKKRKLIEEEWIVLWKYIVLSHNAEEQPVIKALRSKRVK